MSAYFTIHRMQSFLLENPQQTCTPCWPMHSSQENRTCSPKEERFVNEHFQLPTWLQSCIWKLRAYDASSGFGFVKQNDLFPNLHGISANEFLIFLGQLLPFDINITCMQWFPEPSHLLPVTASFAGKGPGACPGPPERHHVDGSKILILEQGAHAIILPPVPQIMYLVLLPQAYV